MPAAERRLTTLFLIVVISATFEDEQSESSGWMSTPTCWKTLFLTRLMY